MYQLKNNFYTISIPREDIADKDKYMKFYPSFYEALSAPSITDQEFRLAIQLMYQLYFEGLKIDSEELPASLYAPFRLIGENLKANRNRSKTNSENGKKGGAKTKENAEKARLLDAEHSAGNTNPISTMETMLEEAVPPKEKTIKKNFQKPLLEDIRNYATENNLSVDTEKFFDFYQSNGWKVGRNAMKDWKATLRNWARRDAPETIPTIPIKKIYELNPCPECGKKLLVWDNSTQKYTCENCKKIFKLGDIF